MSEAANPSPEKRDDLSTEKIYVGDTETTGLTSPIGVMELAYVEINDRMEILSEFVTLVNPGRLAEPEAIEVHGITDEEVSQAVSLDVAMAPLQGSPVVFIGHNVQFDLRLVGGYLDLVGKVCTLALARQYLPQSPNHRLGTIRDYLGLPNFEAHRALGDAHTSLNILRRILVDHGLTLNQVIQRQAKPRMLSVMPFGKHKGTALVMVPQQYRRWLLEQGNLDQDLLYSLQQLENL